MTRGVRARPHAAPPRVPRPASGLVLVDGPRPAPRPAGPARRPSARRRGRRAQRPGRPRRAGRSGTPKVEDRAARSLVVVEGPLTGTVDPARHRRRHDRPRARLHPRARRRLRQQRALPSDPHQRHLGRHATSGRPTAPGSTAPGSPGRPRSPSATSSRSGAPCSSCGGSRGRSCCAPPRAPTSASSAPGNEDSGYAGDQLLVVADGMGGHAAGELASAAAIATMSEMETTGLGDVEALERLSEAVVTTSERIADVVSAHPEFAGMGTTLTALAWLGGDPARVAVLHVGDSRAYLLRDGDVHPGDARPHLRPDAHRLRAHHGRRGARAPAAQPAHAGDRRRPPGRAGRLGARGARGRPLPGLQRRAVAATSPTSASTSCSALADPTAVVTALVEAALEAGAPDNVTCVVADVVEVDDEPETPRRPWWSARPASRATASGCPASRSPTTPRSTRARTPWSACPRAPATGRAASAALADVYAEEQPPAAAPTLPVRWVALARSRRCSSWPPRSASPTPGRAQQYFVGNEGGYVAIFRGLPSDLGPIGMHSVEQVTTLTVDSLPDFEAAQVEATIAADSLAAAAADRAATVRARGVSAPRMPTTPGCPSHRDAIHPSRVDPRRPPDERRLTAAPGRAALPPADTARNRGGAARAGVRRRARRRTSRSTSRSSGKLADDTILVLSAVAALLLVAHVVGPPPRARTPTR